MAIDMSETTATESIDVQDEQTAVDTASDALASNLGALTPSRILGLYVALGTVYVGVQLGQVSVPLSQSLFGFGLFAIAAAHMYSRQRGSTMDVIVAAWTGLGAIVVGVEIGFLSVPFGSNWTALVVVALIVADGYLIERA